MGWEDEREWLERHKAKQAELDEELDSHLGDIPFAFWLMLLFAGIGVVVVARWFIILAWAWLG